MAGAALVPLGKQIVPLSDLSQPPDEKWLRTALLITPLITRPPADRTGGREWLNQAMELAGLEPATSWVRSVSGWGLWGTNGDG